MVLHWGKIFFLKSNAFVHLGQTIYLALHHMQGKKVLSFAWLQKNVFMSNNRLRKLHYESVISQRSSLGGAWRIILGNFPFYSSKVMLWILVGDHTVHGTFSCMQFPWDFSHHAFFRKRVMEVYKEITKQSKSVLDMQLLKFNPSIL